MSDARQGTRSRVLLAGVVIAVMVAGFSSAHAYPRPGKTERVPPQNNGGVNAEISADGRYVAFWSFASNLVSGDTNGASDVFVVDRETGAVERVSVASDGTQADNCQSHAFCSGEPAISADGRYVAFFSNASNLVPGDTNVACDAFGVCLGATDTFVHDRATGVTERVSVASDGAQGNGSSSQSDISITSDGRYVAFASEADNFVPDDTNRRSDVFVHDRATGATELISVASDGTQGGASHHPEMSADGRYVAFFSFGSGLVPEDTNGRPDIFVRDRVEGVTERVSVASDGAEANEQSWRDPSISADGRYVAFSARAWNLVPGDINGTDDVFVHDRETGTTERVSVASDGAEGSGGSLQPAISPDGRYVAFHSIASNLVPGDTNDAADTFVHDRETRATELVSVASDGTQGNSNSHGYPSVSADGRVVAFHSIASNLVQGDTNGEFGFDMFVRDRGGPVGVPELSAVRDAEEILVSGSATFTGQAVASEADPSGDGVSGAREMGAELTGADLVYRPEQEDLLVSLHLASLPFFAPQVCRPVPPGVPLLVVCLAPPSSGGGAPAILYGLEFELGGARYEVRALRAGATGAPPGVPLFALYRCDPVCLEVARLSGGIGTTGDEALVSVPLSALEADEGAALSAMRAFTAVGEAASGAIAALDEVDLPDATIPEREVSLGVAPVTTPADQVVFATRGALQGGAFSGAVNIPPTVGKHHVWARACLGETCEAERVLINIG